MRSKTVKWLDRHRDDATVFDSIAPVPEGAPIERIRQVGKFLYAHSGTNVWVHERRLGWTRVWSTGQWLTWLRKNNARVRFHSNKTVEVMVNNRKSRHRFLTTACERVYARVHGTTSKRTKK